MGGDGRAYAGGGGAPHLIDLRLSQPTVHALTASGYRLCLFRAVTCDLAGGRPLVWGVTSAYSVSMTLTWTDETYGYASTDEAGDGATVRACDYQRIGTGRILDVGANAVTTLDPRAGDPRFVTALNATTTPVTCGLAGRTPLGAGLPHPYCAFPLRGRHLVFLAPLPRVGLTFTSLPLVAGAVVAHIPGPMVLADLGPTGGRAALTYDIDGGWSWHGPQVTHVGVGGLTKALIVPSG